MEFAFGGYVLVGGLLPLLTVTFIPLLHFITSLTYPAFLVCRDKQKCTHLTKLCLESVQSLKIYKSIIKLIFGVIKDGTTEGEIKMFDYVVPELFIVQLFYFVFFIISSAISFFLLGFLIESSSECNPIALDCFPVNNTQESIDCSKFPNITDIMCFWFTLDVGKGFTDGVGVFTVDVVVFCIITWALLTLSGGKDGKRSRKICTILMQIFLLFTSFVTFYIIERLFFASKEPLYKQVSRCLQIIAVYEGFLMSLLVPWYRFKTEQAYTDLRNDDYKLL